MSLGHRRPADGREMAQWPKETASSISATAERFGISESTVKRYCRPT
jgi:putative DNA-invertase from lambdoid prophage Rac